MTRKRSSTEVREDVRRKYGEIAATVHKNQDAGEAACCGPTCCGPADGTTAKDEAANPITSGLYSHDELGELPDAAATASLGCGNPTALAELREGEIVLDLGSGGGIDVLLSAKRVGPTGKAYGLDMTDEMLELARDNQRRAGVGNVEFLKGHIEDIPLPDNSVDVIISNCVINLSTDKRRVLAEAFRVLKPGGRFAVSDVVARGPVPDAIRHNVELWAGCIAGTLEEDEYKELLVAAGFESVEVEPTRIYTADDLGPEYSRGDLTADTVALADGKFMSAFVRAKKPATRN